MEQISRPPIFVGSVPACLPELEVAVANGAVSFSDLRDAVPTTVTLLGAYAPLICIESAGAIIRASQAILTQFTRAVVVAADTLRRGMAIHIRAVDQAVAVIIKLIPACRCTGFVQRSFAAVHGAAAACLRPFTDPVAAAGTRYRFRRAQVTACAASAVVATHRICSATQPATETV
jgi:hypothetical protein